MLPHDNNISSRIITTGPINWKELLFIQQEGFKELTKEAKEKLKASILANQFIQPFYVWLDPLSNPDVQLPSQNPNPYLENPADIYCIDGKHRILILLELLSEGINIPELLPAIFIYCKDKNEAAQLVLVYSSLYAKVTSDGLFDFIKEFDLHFEDLKSFVEMPNIDISILNDRFLPEPSQDELIGHSKNKPVSLKITFETPEQLEEIEPIIKSILDEKCPKAFYSVSAGEL